jgi:hypothetical protein
VLQQGKLQPEQREVLNSVMKEYRLPVYARVDSSKRTLSLAKSLPTIDGLSEEASSQEPRVIVLEKQRKADKVDKKGKARKVFGTAAKAHSGVFSFAAVSDFLEDAINATGSRTEPLSLLKKSPAIYVKGKEPKPRKKKPNTTPRDAQAEKEAKKDEKKSPEEEERERLLQRAKEQKRREQMDREQAEYWGGDGEEDEEDEEGEEEEEEGEEEREDLD